jgi:transposase
MSMARLVITAVTIEGRGKSEVARVYGVSRVWVQKLIHRFEADGERSGIVASRSPGDGQHRGADRIPRHGGPGPRR